MVVGKSSFKHIMHDIYMVMEYVEHDLKQLSEHMKQPFSISEVRHHTETSVDICKLLNLLMHESILHLLGDGGCGDWLETAQQAPKAALQSLERCGTTLNPNPTPNHPLNAAGCTCKRHRCCGRSVRPGTILYNEGKA